MRLIYFAPVPFSSYRQRPHYVVESLLKEGAVKSVTWVDPYPTRLPRLDDLRRRPPAAAVNVATPDALTVLTPPAWPIEPLPGGAWINSRRWGEVRNRLGQHALQDSCVLGVGRPSALAAWALRHLSAAGRFFDAMDDFPAFYRGLSARSMARWEKEVVAHVDLVVVSSTALQHKFHALPAKVQRQKILNGYPCRDLQRGARPPRQRPLIGYVGSIASWFDWELLREMAARLPQADIHLYGPLFTAPPQLPGNVRLYGPVSHLQAWDLACGFDIGIIPFAVNRLTEGVDPVKYYEYRAAGLPVWTTAFGEMRQRAGLDGVQTIAAGMDWNALMAAALAWNNAPDLAACEREFDWRQRCVPLAAWLRKRRGHGFERKTANAGNTF